MLRPEDLGVQLACPDCRRPLARIDHLYVCSDGVCRRAYSVVDEIPALVVEESHILELADWQEHMATHAAAQPPVPGDSDAQPRPQ